jgi:hypothetical protein
MRLYGKKNIRSLVDKRSKKRQEMRDGIIWQITGSECEVKLQGSNTKVVAHFPKNQKEVPYWLRIGNAVKVVHKNGIRGYLEVIGEGRCIPTPLEDGTFPSIGSLSDGIMSGLVVTSTSPPSLNTQISSGTFRIDGVTYTMAEVTGGYVVMDDPAPMVMGIIPFVLNGQVFYTLTAAPPVGYFRYDIIIVGVDGDLTLIEGVEVTSDPVMPSVPSGYLLVAFVLRVGGDTVVPMNRINQLYEFLYPVEFNLPSGLEFPWDGVINNPEINFQVDIKDQYGHAISSADGWVLKLKILVGTGEVWSAYSGYSSSEVQQDMVSASTYTFKYRRDQTASPETSPYLQVTLEGSVSTVYGFERIVLLDSGGSPV